MKYEWKINRRVRRPFGLGFKIELSAGYIGTQVGDPRPRLLYSADLLLWHREFCFSVTRIG